MKINNEFAPVMKSSTKMETSQASIAMTAHMFQVLSAGIYQHPERACIRELSCNAYDGHVAAGNQDKPFRVHLPTSLEPYFEVRDFGTGMTHEQIMHLYLTYGASTKRDSDDQIGGLGIGSKSPFAVAQSFTATSYLDGVVRRYSIYMEEGVPQVTKLTESATTEPNGIAVRVAIPTDKISKFREEANLIYTHFPVKPECNIELVSIYKDRPVLSKSPGEFVIFSGENRNSTIETSIVMGNIEYPIKMSDVADEISKAIPDYLIRNITKALIYMPIGSVNIAASRESLQLTDSTKKEITQVFEKVAKEILSKLQSEIDTAKDLYEAVVLFNKATSGVRGGFVSIAPHINWSGKSMAEWSREQAVCRSRVMIDPATGLPLKNHHNNQERREFIFPNMTYYRIWSVQRNSERRLESYSINDERYFSIFNEMSHPTLPDQTLFVIDDRLQKNGAIKTVGRHAVLRELVNKFTEGKNVNDGKVFMVKDEAEVKALAALHHYPEAMLNIRKMSDYDYAYVPKKVVRGQVKLWESVKGQRPREVKVSMDDYDVPQYYIKAEGADLHSATLRDNMELPDLLSVLSSIVPTEHVFMFRKTVWNKIPEDWIEIDVNVLKKAVKNSPELYINLNRHQMCDTAYRNHPDFNYMDVKLKMTFNNKGIENGNVDYIARTNVPDPRGVNFEDNIELFADLFGRPSIIFADIFYRSMHHDRQPLEKLADVLPVDDKLRRSIQNAQVRAKRNFEKEKARFEAKYPLLSWIDWGKVSLRQVAEHLGYKNLTPYTDK